VQEIRLCCDRAAWIFLVPLIRKEPPNFRLVGSPQEFGLVPTWKVSAVDSIGRCNTI
jgi:hypothetical protein